jgi:hypothetical protein
MDLILASFVSKLLKSDLVKINQLKLQNQIFYEDKKAY